ncbi:TraR/DksA family transcriptional regulator [Fimbriiglobus ruber]|uniref:DnaK suppressor protein n=1 Tax=Fimbriiglobus ruber TaxID=1908690 RepID=A0A225DP56_9BACT|nr:TraR/DksA C4-type zinc finger protein [Fimbriiglobus ruber]OWK37947.1 DnaK suppressor protein [Fimbriiglobus ruber]
MTGENTKKYRANLQALATQIRATVAGLTDQATSPLGGESAGGISNAPLHLADMGSEAYNQELGATLLENELFIGEEVAAALERLNNGTYGKCEGCGKAVAAERLDALPYVRHCVVCATKLQSGRPINLNAGRPAGWLGAPGYEGMHQTGSPVRTVGRDLGGAPNDVHAAGTPGGGTAVGGLAGTTIGDGALDDVNLEQAAAGREEEPRDEAEEEAGGAYSGPTGGAVGGSPANKRTRGGNAKNPADLGRTGGK